mgnify:CR=1 FL=1
MAIINPDLVSKYSSSHHIRDFYPHFFCVSINQHREFSPCRGNDVLCIDGACRRHLPAGRLIDLKAVDIGHEDARLEQLHQFQSYRNLNLGNRVTLIGDDGDIDRVVGVDPAFQIVATFGLSMVVQNLIYEKYTADTQGLERHALRIEHPEDIMIRGQQQVGGIAELRDESSGRTGMRLCIVLKRDAVAKVVLNNLYKHTQLQDTFGANMLALVDGQPQTLPLKSILQHHIEWRREARGNATLPYDDTDFAWFTGRRGLRVVAGGMLYRAAGVVGLTNVVAEAADAGARKKRARA